MFCLQCFFFFFCGELKPSASWKKCTLLTKTETFKATVSIHILPWCHPGCAFFPLLSIPRFSLAGQSWNVSFKIHKKWISMWKAARREAVWWLQLISGMDTASEGEADKRDEDESGGVTTEIGWRWERWQRMKRVETEVVNFRKLSRERLHWFGLDTSSKMQKNNGGFCQRWSNTVWNNTRQIEGFPRSWVILFSASLLNLLLAID